MQVIVSDETKKGKVVALCDTLVNEWKAEVAKEFTERLTTEEKQEGVTVNLIPLTYMQKESRIHWDSIRFLGEQTVTRQGHRRSYGIYACRSGWQKFRGGIKANSGPKAKEGSCGGKMFQFRITKAQEAQALLLGEKIPELAGKTNSERVRFIVQRGLKQITTHGLTPQKQRSATGTNKESAEAIRLLKPYQAMALKLKETHGLVDYTLMKWAFQVGLDTVAMEMKD